MEFGLRNNRFSLSAFNSSILATKLPLFCPNFAFVNTGLKALLFAEYPHSQIFPQIENP